MFFPFIVASHDINIENKSIEETVKKRMGNMSKIKAYLTKIYSLIFSGEFEAIKKFYISYSMLKKTVYHSLKILTIWLLIEERAIKN